MADDPAAPVRKDPKGVPIGKDGHPLRLREIVCPECGERGCLKWWPHDV